MSSDSGPSRSPAKPVVVGGFLSLLAITIPNAYGAAVPGVSDSSGIGVATVGQLTAVHGVGAFIGLMVWVVVSRRYPTRRVARVSLATLLLGALLVAANPIAARTPTGTGAFVALAATVALIGVAFGVLIVATNTYLANRGGSARLLNSANGMYGVGAVVLPLVVGAADLRAAALVTAGLAAITLPALRAVPDLSGELRASAERTAARSAERRARRRAGEGGLDRSSRESARAVWHGNGSRPWVWVFSVAIGAEIGTAAWAATHLVSLGVDEGRAATAVAGFFAAFTLARFVMGWIGDRWSRRSVVVGSNVIAACGAFAAAVVPVPSLAWVAVGIGVGPVFGTTLAWMTAVTGDPDGTRRMNVGGAFGGVLLPGLVGVLVGAFGAGAIPWAIGGFALVAAGLAARLPTVDDQRPGPPGAAAPTSD